VAVLFQDDEEGHDRSIGKYWYGAAMIYDMIYDPTSARMLSTVRLFALHVLFAVCSFSHMFSVKVLLWSFVDYLAILVADPFE